MFRSVRSRLGYPAAALAACAATVAAAAVIAAPGSEGAKLVATGGVVSVTYLGSTAFFENRVYLDDGDGVRANDRLLFDNRNFPVGSRIELGEFEAGVELLLRLEVVNNGTRFVTGPAARNMDGLPHARVQAEWRPGKTLVSFEDLNTGPLDYDDFSIAFTNATAEAGGDQTADAGPLATPTGATPARLR